ncbi:WGR domain, putative DNA-binding domain in MolR (plasmid) [Nostoc flagelliforme CCNUN1]|uniref:WGR domain, putative DNA-binding domain in MolR n=1 Tax=Nostoc flagelliforme CCNUN1 TaxID=2038116 RepID=A0A2K8T7N2_9NOSO|nr:WGR domain-containing protein [Nostoc flagelliforme]AUB43660.1 WGR domain, putative DNA-binding domain in MolR [Nostoc flagelliforme CCNUN1]
MEIYLVFVDAIQNSNKFWSAKVEGSNLTVQWGRVGYQAQTKVHSCSSHQQAINKFNNLVAEKKTKGYSESQPEIDASRSVADIRQAIQLLNTIRMAVALQNFGDSYISALNEYLKIVPTPLGMQIDYHGIYRTVTDVDYQMRLLNSLLATPAPLAAVAVGHAPEATTETKVVSLKTISKNFWRHL